ncbi:acyltransferase family protein [Desulfosporosinus youngiae]|uniref:DUF5009 domain-containing protein n=1 Tax=Desulfosporosinus youngiae DSM 17734 TaxID=768710 RepID=H5XUS3_9FIRM|nr:DUF5009 domain-containing protein [Desulfosporosinus youngiae]EHQ89230.1 hypothetical protein DesyoDRAFT_2145 [Desulfosporosinus youngiae DSM 17734]
MEKGKLRFDCIDIFRGLTISLMLICSNPGNITNIPAQLRHADWNGATIGDFVFPFFIFSMGIVVPIAINRRLEKGISQMRIIINVLNRSIVMFLLGLILNGFPTFDLAIIRVPGVLQRIAIVYFCSALIYLLFKSIVKKDLVQIGILTLIAVLLLAIYYWLLKGLQVPGIEGLKGGLVSYIDLKYLKGHLYTPTFDPEGILSTIPALSSGIIGVVVGMIFLRRDSRFVKMTIFVCSGILLIIFAEWFNAYFPYNKQLWSSSFVLLTSGFGILVLTIFYLLTDILKIGRTLTPFKAIGASPIFVYFISEIIGRSLWQIPIKDSISGNIMTFKFWITERFISPWAHGLDSVYFSVSYALVWMAIMGFLYHKKIHIRL